MTYMFKGEPGWARVGGRVVGGFGGRGARIRDTEKFKLDDRSRSSFMQCDRPLVYQFITQNTTPQFPAPECVTWFSEGVGGGGADVAPSAAAASLI